MLKLYKHQEELKQIDPKKCGIFWGTGGSKTIMALVLAKGKTLVVCPKILREDETWQKNLLKLGKSLDLTVVSKEDFRRDWEQYSRYDTVIYDECHQICGISPVFKWVKKQPIPKTSQLFNACYKFIQQTNPSRLYLLTATPVRNPLAVFALLVLLGKSTMDKFESFRRTFYIPVLMNHREIYMAKKDDETKNKLGKLVQSMGYTGRLSDFADVPEQTHRVVNVPLSKEQEARLKTITIDYPDPLVLIGKKHQIEQGVLKGDEYSKSETFDTGKLEVIEDLYEEFGKVLVFAKYTEQIQQIYDYFRNKYGYDLQISILNGQTKDRGSVIEDAEKVKKTVVIAQSGISAGWEFPSCRCTVYASQDYSFVNYSQSLGRTLRINNLQKNLYVYLLSGEIDRAVYKALENKGDFQEATYAKVL